MTTGWAADPSLGLDPALPVVEEVLQTLRRQKRLSPEEWEDFHSWAWLKLLESDCAPVRKFEGRGSLRAYLAVVLNRYLLDYRTQKWGKWRPSTGARAMGPIAVELERLIQCGGYQASEAAKSLMARQDCDLNEDELLELAARLPVRRRTWTASEAWLDALPSPRSGPEAHLQEREAERARANIERALERGLAGLNPEDRLALKLRFEQGLKLNEVARALGRDPKRFYRRFDRVLGRLLRSFRKDGVAVGELRFAFPDTERTFSRRSTHTHK